MPLEKTTNLIYYLFNNYLIIYFILAYEKLIKIPVHAFLPKNAPFPEFPTFCAIIYYTIFFLLFFFTIDTPTQAKQASEQVVILCVW